MSAVVFAQRITDTPPPRQVVNPEYTHLWHGVDGTTWDMNDWRSGVYMQSGIVGLGHAGVDRWTFQSPALAGNIFGGSRTQELAVQWPIVIAAQAAPDWKDLVRRWWRSWSTDTPGTWEVRDSSGRSLSLDLRLNPSPGFSLSLDPGLLPWVPWTVDAVADQPYWRGAAITESWGSAGTPEPFFDTTTGIWPFHIMLASTFAGASLSNPGTRDASLILTAEGPLDAFTITIGDGTITGPAVAAGDWITMDTRPHNLIALKNDTVDVTRNFADYDPRPVPPGVDVPITITTIGEGTITAELTPLYEIGF